jgi:hypothetical protein
MLWALRRFVSSFSKLLMSCVSFDRMWVCLASGSFLIFLTFETMSDCYAFFVTFVLNIPFKRLSMFFIFCLLLLFEHFFL